MSAAALIFSAPSNALDLNPKDGTYVLEIGGKQFGMDHYFNLNSGDEIELPRGEFSIENNDEGFIVRGCLSIYRGSNIDIRQVCGENGGSIYCRTVPDWVEVSGPEELASAKEVIEIYLKPESDGVLKLKVTDDTGASGGPVDSFNRENKYVLAKDRALKCVFNN